MPTAARFAFLTLLAVLGGAQTGCNMVPRQELLQSQNRTKQLYEQNKALAMERQNMAAENVRLQQQLADANGSRSTLEQRLANLNGERSKLQSMLASQRSPLSSDTTRQLEELRKKFPEFQFDPQTGVSKFDTDLLFETASADVKSNAGGALQAFAKILNSGDAQQLNILVVGHTDDQRIAKASTAAKHPTNWHLSAHRAINVEAELKKYGINEKRMGVAAYGPYQPLVANSSAENRRKNRRVEIFVLAPNASLAGVDNNTLRK